LRDERNLAIGANGESLTILGLALWAKHGP